MQLFFKFKDGSSKMISFFTSHSHLFLKELFKLCDNFGIFIDLMVEIIAFMG